jgi:hypothetical protein
MQVAGDRLRTTESNIATIAHEVGYESEGEQALSVIRPVIEC